MRKRNVTILISILLAANFFAHQGVYAEERLASLRKMAISAYSQEERELLREKAMAIEAGSSGAVPIGIDRIVSAGLVFKFDTPPVIKDGRTLVPVRSVSEAFEASVLWDPSERKVSVKKGSRELTVWIDETETVVEGRRRTIDVPAMILNGRAMVPLRFVCEGLGLAIRYHEASRVIEIGE